MTVGGGTGVYTPCPNPSALAEDTPGDGAKRRVMRQGSDHGTHYSSSWKARRTNSVVSAVSVATAASLSSVTSLHHAGQREIKVEGSSGGSFVQWGRLLIRSPHTVILVWAIIVLISCLLAPSLLFEVKYSYEPEPGSPSGRSKAALDFHFPGLLEQVVDSVLFTLRPGVRQHQAELVIEQAYSDVDKVLTKLELSNPGLIANVRSWKKQQTGGESSLSYISADHRIWLMEVVWRAPSRFGDRHSIDSAAQEMLQALAGLNETYAPSGVEIAATGPHALRQVVMEQARHDVGLHAVMFLPIAVLAIHTHLWKWELLPLPALCSLVALVLSFALGFLVACARTMDATVPTLMAFLSISLCIDWSFFLLARFQEETIRGVAHGDAILTALVRTGSNIALSGLLIIVCSMCMLMMPAAIASNAVGGCITVVSALSCCLTLLPACLAAWPAWFASDRRAFQQRDESEALVSNSKAAATRKEGYSIDDEDDASDSHPLGLVGSASGGISRLGEKVQQCQHAAWYVWAALVTTFPCNVIVLVCICVFFAPATFKLFGFVPAVDDALFYPPGSPAVMAMDVVHREFVGKLHSKSQMYILVEADHECRRGVTSNGYFNATCALAKLIIGEVSRPDRPLKAADVLGVSFYNNRQGVNDFKCIPFHMHFATIPDAIAAMGNHTVDAQFMLTGKVKGASLFPSAEYERYHLMYEQLWKRVVSLDRRATLLVIQLPWDAMSWPGFKTVEDLRRLLASPSAALPHMPYGMDAHDMDEALACSRLVSSEISLPSIWYDYITASVGLLPRSLLLACLVTTPFVALSFRAVFAPLKLLLTVILPLTWVYGLAVLCFQDGVFGLQQDSRGFYWMVPCSTSMLLLALALDYNIFYFGRVFEFRKAGLSDLEAIRQGLAATGPVITCAGIIFAVEFSGLLFSETSVNRQGGFVVVVGILLDTFVVRSCLTPATLSLCAELNWWPTTMPTPVPEDDVASVLGSRQSSIIASRSASMESDDGLCCDGGL